MRSGRSILTLQTPHHAGPRPPGSIPTPAPPRVAPHIAPREPHRIRLRGPWEWTPSGESPVPARLPFVAKTPGTLRRFFNTPTGLEDGTTVRLRVVADPPDPPATLNDRTIRGPLDGGHDADLTPSLGAGGSPCRLELAVAAGATVEAVTLELHLPSPPSD